MGPQGETLEEQGASLSLLGQTQRELARSEAEVGALKQERADMLAGMEKQRAALQMLQRESGASLQQIISLQRKAADDKMSMQARVGRGG